MTLVLVALAACGGVINGTEASPTGAAGGAVASDDLAKISAWAGPGHRVEAWKGGSAGGYAIYVVANEVVSGAALGADGTPRRGSEALQAILAAGERDPTRLAGLCILFLETPSVLREPLAGPTEPDALKFPEEAKLVTAPKIEGGTLEYWHLDNRPPGLTRVRVQLETLATDVQRAAWLLEGG